MRKVLSIDGGGIRGIIPALVLAKIEHYTGKPISGIFDLIAGTSTGGILALGLAKPGGAGGPQYSAEQLAGLYEEHGRTIFPQPLWRELRPLSRLIEQKYPAKGIEAVLKEYFGDSALRQALTDVLVTSYEIERRTPFFFRSANARRDPNYDFPMRLAARATSAAPTYFEPLKIHTGGATGYYALVDGGLFANNPAMCALAEAHNLFPREELLLVSLGTGSMTRPLPYEKARKWGVARWAKPVLDIAFDGVSSTVDYQLRQLLPRTAEMRHYYRFQPVLDPLLQMMDNASPRNVRELKLLAESYLRQQEDDIVELCEILSRLRPNELPIQCAQPVACAIGDCD